MEQIKIAAPVTAKPADLEYQPVPTAEINANYPVSVTSVLRLCYIDDIGHAITCNIIIMTLI